MKAVVVYESHWGNTEAVALAIARGIGSEARAMTTSEATASVVADAELLVVGAPVLGFRLGTEDMVAALAAERGPRPADLSNPTVRSWLAGFPRGSERSASFETGLWWSPGGAAGAIDKALAASGYRPLAKTRRFVVTGRYGPLRDGELERARAWGAELAAAAAGELAGAGRA